MSDRSRSTRIYPDQPYSVERVATDPNQTPQIFTHDRLDRNSNPSIYVRDGWKDFVPHFVEITGEAWEDLRFPAQGIALGGLTSPPGQATDGTLLFDSGASIETIAGVAQLPHAWDEGTAIIPHVHWGKVATGAGNVLWRFRYRVADIGGVFSAWSSWDSGTDVVTVDATADKHYLATFSEIDMSGKTLSSIITWQFGRDPTNGADTYVAGDAKLYEVDFHYRVNTFGSRQEAIKDYP